MEEKPIDETPCLFFTVSTRISCTLWHSFTLGSTLVSLGNLSMRKSFINSSTSPLLHSQSFGLPFLISSARETGLKRMKKPSNTSYLQRMEISILTEEAMKITS